MVTRRCTQRKYLLRPDDVTNNAVIYCLAVAAEKYDVTVIDFIAMSNHVHEVIFDKHGNSPAFYEHFHKLLAKCMNVYRRRWENFFSSDPVSVVQLVSTEDVINKLVYVATNAVKAGLVARVDDWPGAFGYRALLRGEPLRATRPKHYFAANGRMPKSVELRLTIQPELGDQTEILAEVQKRVAAVEAEEAQKRAAKGRPVVGRAGVLAQSWRAGPTTRERRRGLRPTVAAKRRSTRLEALQQKRDFLDAYRKARGALLAGTPIPFPYGTYALHRFVGVAVEPAQKFN